MVVVVAAMTVAAVDEAEVRRWWRQGWDYVELAHRVAPSTVNMGFGYYSRWRPH
jgi:hypothetical protein